MLNIRNNLEIFWSLRFVIILIVTMKKITGSLYKGEFIISLDCQVGELFKINVDCTKYNKDNLDELYGLYNSFSHYINKCKENLLLM